MRVLYVYSAPRMWWDYEERLVKSVNATEADIHIDFWNWVKEYGLPRNPTLSWTYEHRDEMLEFYNELKRRAEKADVVLISPGGGILPEVMAELPQLVVYSTTDDPDSSETCSFPFLKAVDVIAHAGVNFDSKRRLSDVFLGRGAKRCIFRPLAFYEKMFPEIDDFEAQFARRDIDLVYVGYPVKHGKLDKIMRHYRQMVVYGRVTLKRAIYILLTTGHRYRPFTGDLGQLYQRTKVGINVHFTYGPCNGRCYQLNAAGVAQVIDCPEGVPQIYKPGTEVLVHSSPEEAIEKIDLLLADDSLRYRVSKAGYDRARAEYSKKHTWLTLLRSL